MTIANAAGLVLLCCLVGCGLGYRAKPVSVNASPHDGATTSFGPNRLGFQGSGFAHELTLYDRSGILLSLLGTAANRAAARNQAIKEMTKSGRTSGGYSYQQTPLVPGPEFRASIVFGSGSGFDLDLDGTMVPVDDGDLTVRGLGFGWDIGTVSLTERLAIDFAAEGHFRRYTARPGRDTSLTSADEEVKRSPFYLPVLARVSFLVTPRVRLSGSVGYDPIQSLLRALLGGGQLYGARPSTFTARSGATLRRISGCRRNAHAETRRSGPAVLAAPAGRVEPVRVRTTYNRQRLLN